MSAAGQGAPVPDCTISCNEPPASGPLRCLLPMPVLLRPAGIHDGKQ